LRKVSWIFCAGLVSIADLLTVDRQVPTARSVLSLLLATAVGPALVRNSVRWCATLTGKYLYDTALLPAFQAGHCSFETTWGQPPSAVQRSAAPQFGPSKTLASVARPDSRGQLSPRVSCAAVARLARLTSPAQNATILAFKSSRRRRAAALRLSFGSYLCIM
jgi:hypothetical protein